MKNKSSKTILVFFALGLISCAFCVQQAQAVPQNGTITIAGGAQLADANGFPVNSVNDATQVTGWLDGDGAMPTVQSVSGSMATWVTAGDTVTFPSTWTFGSGVAVLWQVDGFTFSLIASSIVYQANGFLAVSGTGTLTGNGFHAAPGTWNFTAQDDPANGVFSFSSGSLVPDGGATVALLGLALAGIEGTRRKLTRAKS